MNKQTKENPVMENGMPLVSIIISSYNYAQFLSDAIDSALHQSYPNKEVIVVDDGSKDDSPKIISSYGERIIPIIKENNGQASALNRGFYASKGSIIIFLDSDDVLYPDAVTHVVEIFKNPVVKAHWLLDEIDAEGKKRDKRTSTIPQAEGNLLQEIIQYGPLKSGGPPYSPPTSGNAWSRNYLEHIMPIPEDLYRSSADQYLHALVPAYGELRAIGKSLGGYRVHGDNYSLHPILDFANEYLERYEHSCKILHNHLAQQGIESDPAQWPRDSWYHRIKSGVDDILWLVPNSHGFILVDENAWGLDNAFGNRKRFHLIDHEGQYYGPPENDELAIAEIERIKGEGADYIFFTPNTFWWLDHYAGMSSYLQDKYPRILDNERMIGFHLQSELT